MKQQLKIFTSFVLTWTFLAISITGLGLYLSPQGRIANWIQWRFLGFTKTEWSELHTVFVTVFLVAGILHLFYFNWKSFLNYFKKKIKRGTHYRNELIISLLILLILFLGTIWKVPPIFSIVTLGENIKASYEVRKNEPPIPHAEDMTISEFSSKILSMAYDDVVERLKSNGFSISGPDQIIAEIAELHDVAPSEILTMAMGDQNKKLKIPPYTGYGRKTLDEVCFELHIKLDSVITRLNQVGKTDIDSSMTIKQIADIYNQNPTDIISIINGEKSL